jgi:tetratricopeptide (TPR) repeat protein
MLSHWGDLPGAIELSRTALDVMIASNDTVGVVSAAFTLAQAQWYAGDLEDARDVLVSNLALARSEAGQKRSPATFVLPASVFLAYLARIHTDLGDTDAGFAALREAHAVTDRYGHAFDQVLVNSYEGAMLLASSEVAAAIDVLEPTLGNARANKIEWHVPMIACVLGQAYVETGRHVEARRLLESACEFADRNRHVAKRLLCGPPLVRALAEGPDADLPAAEDLATRTLREAAARGFRPIVVQTQMALARVMALRGDHESAAGALREAVALARRVGLRREEMAARDRLAALLRHDGTPLACKQ